MYHKRAEFHRESIMGKKKPSNNEMCHFKLQYIGKILAITNLLTLLITFNEVHVQ